MLPRFLWTTVSLVASVVVILCAAVVCVLAWRRSGWKRSTGILEAIRFAIIVLAVITLNQPEYEQEIKPTQQPTLVVLYDDTGSMDTRDVVDASNPTSTPITRTAAIKLALDD